VAAQVADARLQLARIQADAAWAQLRGEAESDVHALELVSHTLASALTVVRHDRAKRAKTG
jgi:hypothetical protein